MISKHVTSLDWSRKLKEVGYPQESIFYWIKEGEKFEVGQFSFGIPAGTICYAAPTASEILERLPKEIELTNRHYGKIDCNEKGEIYDLVIRWYPDKTIEIAYDYYDEQDTHKNINCEYNKNICDALAKMYIYLVENKLLEVK